MTYPQDHDPIGLNALADKMGPDRYQLAPVLSDGSPPVWHGIEGLGRIQQALSHPLRRAGTEFDDVVADSDQVGPGLTGPDNAAHAQPSRGGGGVSSERPQESSQSRIAS